MLSAAANGFACQRYVVCLKSNLTFLCTSTKTCTNVLKLKLCYLRYLESHWCYQKKRSWKLLDALWIGLQGTTGNIVINSTKICQHQRLWETRKICTNGFSQLFSDRTSGLRLNKQNKAAFSWKQFQNKYFNIKYLRKYEVCTKIWKR
jgi:hypothetical protein